MNKLLSLFLLVVLVPLISRADAYHLLPLTGRVFADVYVPTNNSFPDKPLEQLTGSLWLETNPKINDDNGFKFIYLGTGYDGSSASYTGNSSSNHLESSLREGYFTTHTSSIEFRVGRQIISWGKADFLNPTDYLSAKNFSLFNPDEEIKRLGGYSAMLTITPHEGVSPWTFTSVWTFIFPQSVLLFPPEFIPANAAVATEATTPPSEFQNGEFAQKVAYAGSGWDMSASFFSGWSHMPELEEASHTIVGSDVFVNLNQVFRRITAFGIDGSATLGDWVLKAESAYTITPNNVGSDPRLLPTHWDSVVGAEHSLGGNFRVQAQIYIRYLPHPTSPGDAVGSDPISQQINQIVAQANALLLQYQDRSRPTSSVRISYSDEKTGVDGELFYLQSFDGGDYFVRPKMGYACSDVLHMSLGLNLYGGPSDRPLGVLSHLSAAFYEAKYSF